MEVKKILLLFVFCFICLSPAAFAQQSKQEDHHEQHERIAAARIAHITSRLELSPQEAEKFWPVYNEFYAKREALRNQHREVMQGVRKKEPTPIEAQRAIDHHLQTEREEARLAEEYYGNKLKAVLNSVQMLKLMQAEYEFKKMLLDKLKEKRAH